MKTPIQMGRMAALWLFCSCILNGYTQSLSEMHRHPYRFFDSTRISTPFLIDRSSNFSGINGDKIYSDTQSYSKNDWMQSYMDLYNAQYATHLNSRLSRNPNTIISNIEGYRIAGLHPIGILLKKYNQIPEENYGSPNLAYDSITDCYKFANFNYETEENIAFSIAPLVPYIENNMLNLIFEQDFIFNDLPIESIRIQIAQLQIDRFVDLNKTLSLNLNDLPNSVKDIKVIVTLKSGSKLYRGTMLMKRYLPVADPDYVQNNFEFQNRCAFNAPYGYGDAKAYVLWSDEAKAKITKPIIIVEGYDPSSKEYGAIGWRTLNEGISINENGESVYPQLKEMPALGTALTSAGYDIIFVDFKHSGERIEKNAATLAKIIQWVNNKTESDEKVVLMGASMGGLICQNALNILDNAGCNSCVNTYVSFDAPYHGANVPLGIQEFVKFAYEAMYEARLQYEYKLNTFAAKQMLYYHVNDAGERANWLNNYSTFNKKIAAFNICLASSSKSGIKFGINDGDELLYWGISNKYTLKPYLYTHIFSMNRFNNMLLQAKFPKHYYKFAGGTVGVKYDVDYNAYTRAPFVGKQNYDGVAGSSSNYIGEVFDIMSKMNQTIKSNNLIINAPVAGKGELHTFVPTISALDLTEKDPNFNIMNLSQEDPSTLHAFDLIHFAGINEPHVYINSTNIDYTIHSLTRVSSAPANLTSGQFNLSSTKYGILNSTTIKSGALLGLNNYALSNFGNSSTDHYPINSRVYIRSSNCSTHVLCESNASIVLGGTGPSNTQYTAQVEFRKGSILELQSDAILRIRDNSTLIIEEGALLIVHPGAQIILEGENAVLEVRGTVRLENNAVFGFTKGAAAKGGYIRFNFTDANSLSNTHHFQLMGANCKINLSGETHFSDKILEIKGKTILELPYLLNSSGHQLAEFRLKDGNVEFDGDGKIEAGCPLFVKNVNFNQTKGKNGIGLSTHGQSNLTIEDCEFNNLKTGLIANNNHLSNDLTIKNNRFYNCASGIEAAGRSITLDYGEFSNCGFAFVPQATTNLLLKNTHFIYNTIGIETNGSNGHMRIENGWFLHNETGINDYNASKITISCTPFEQNEVAVRSNGKINMSSTYTFSGQTAGGGNNTFFQNDVSFELDMAEIHLVNGNNNFMVGNTGQTPHYFKGTLKSSTSYVSNNTLDVSGNYFDNLPSGGIGSASGTFYSLKAHTGVGPHGSPVTFNGSVSGSMNSNCFSFPRIYPDHKSEVTYTPKVYNFGEQTGISDLNVYPNPTSDVIVLEVKSQTVSTSKIILYDLSGKEIYATELQLLPGTNRTQILMRNIADPGVYILKISDDQGVYETLKISLNY